MSARLSATDFDSFFTELWGHEPFPWQTRLAARVLDEGWPTLLDLPTGSGKTAALDVALFALAVDPSRHPRRIALVVDRRTIVDQAAVRARALAAALARAEAGADRQATLPRVAEALRGLARRSSTWLCYAAGFPARPTGRAPQPVLPCSCRQSIKSGAGCCSAATACRTA